MEITAELGASFVIEAVQFQVKVLQHFVDLQRLSDISATLVVNLVIGEIKVGQYLSVK